MRPWFDLVAMVRGRGGEKRNMKAREEARSRKIFVFQLSANCRAPPLIGVAIHCMTQAARATRVARANETANVRGHQTLGACRIGQATSTLGLIGAS